MQMKSDPACKSDVMHCQLEQGNLSESMRNADRGYIFQHRGWNHMKISCDPHAILMECIANLNTATSQKAYKTLNWDAYSSTELESRGNGIGIRM